MIKKRILGNIDNILGSHNYDGVCPHLSIGLHNDLRHRIVGHERMINMRRGIRNLAVRDLLNNNPSGIKKPSKNKIS
jgi:hypothetical protein